ncbi:S41 family peptidase [Oceanobacter mangrovi]|uniref:S41 family peptidase n=1 Tax=Oceanobacter mangrovi TaxID=2862510 RepID=UPI001C8D1E62|nr:S41 family peptidase [Oceanobacter mangrovi]
MKFCRPAISALAVTLFSLSFSVSATADTVPAAAAPADQSQTELPLEELRNFAEAFERIRSSYVEEVDDETLFGYAINGMLTALDPHSVYLQPEDFSELRETTTGKFGGLGLEVGQQDGLVLVITPIDDTPAQKAGIKAGDLIVTLDGEAVVGMSLGEAIEKMRGEPGSPITLEIRRDNEPTLLSFTVERDEIKVRSVRSKLLSDDIGYIRITQFQEETGAELNKTLKKWQDDKAVKGVILDLRNNPGGVLDAAVDVSNAFLDNGLIVYTEGRAASSKLKFSANSDTTARDLPLIVLINGGSASASEIVAGALQDHKRAVLVGTQSFGKGSVQTVLPLANDKAIKLTTARYFTPSGRSIQAKGIEPDIWVEQSDVTPIARNRTIKEADLRGHLDNPNQDKSADQNKEISKDDSQNDTELLAKDFQLYEAHTLLKGMAILGKH